MQQKELPSSIEFGQSNISPWALHDEWRQTKQKFDIENYAEIKNQMAVSPAPSSLGVLGPSYSPNLSERQHEILAI